MELKFLLGLVTALVLLSLFLLSQLRSQAQELQFESLILQMWKSELALESEKVRQLQSQILKLEESVMAKEKELESLRYRT